MTLIPPVPAVAIGATGTINAVAVELISFNSPKIESEAAEYMLLGAAWKKRIGGCQKDGGEFTFVQAFDPTTGTSCADNIALVGAAASVVCVITKGSWTTTFNGILTGVEISEYANNSEILTATFTGSTDGAVVFAGS